jgi:hypothetical protein
MENRKAFNFYRSYYDVAMKLSNEDRCEFLTALLQKQFDGIEPKLTGMAEFAYISQRHAIDSQIKGFVSKTKSTPTEPPYQPPTEPPTEPPSVQEQGEEQEKEKEKGQGEVQVQDLVDTSTENYDDIIFGNKSVEGLDKVLERWDIL